MRVYLKNQNISRAFSIVEVIVAAAIFTITLAAFVASFEFFNSIENQTEEKTTAAFLLEETSEAVVLLRDFAWENISELNQGDWYYLSWNGSEYVLSESDEENSLYARRVMVFSVYRDNLGNLAGAGTEDLNTKRVVIEILGRDRSQIISTAEMLVHNNYE